VPCCRGGPQWDGQAVRDPIARRIRPGTTPVDSMDTAASPTSHPSPRRPISSALHRSLGKSRDDDIREPDRRNARSKRWPTPSSDSSCAAHRVDCPPLNVERADAPILRVAPVLTSTLIVVRQPSTELPKSPLHNEDLYPAGAGIGCWVAAMKSSFGWRLSPLSH
jgi:hypothetical protein